MNMPDHRAKPALRLSFEREPSLELRRSLGDRIRAFNASRVPAEDAQRFAYLLHHDAAPCAAVVGVIFGGWLFVESLWVEEAQRGTGVGRALLAQAEAYAREQGCHDVWLDTFQARAFYEKQGYRVFGELEAYPAGQTRCFLRKALG